MLFAIEKINQQETLAKVQEQVEQHNATIIDDFALSNGNPLDGDWTGFPDVDALEASTQKDRRQHTIGQPNASL